jgi:hypothetical protein
MYIADLEVAGMYSHLGTTVHCAAQCLNVTLEDISTVLRT